MRFQTDLVVLQDIFFCCFAGIILSLWPEYFSFLQVLFCRFGQNKTLIVSLSILSHSALIQRSFCRFGLNDYQPILSLKSLEGGRRCGL